MYAQVSFGYIGSGSKVWAQFRKSSQVQSKEVADLLLSLRSLVHVIMVHFGLTIRLTDKALAFKSSN